MEWIGAVFLGASVVALLFNKVGIGAGLLTIALACFGIWFILLPT